MTLTFPIDGPFAIWWRLTPRALLVSILKAPIILAPLLILVQMLSFVSCACFLTPILKICDLPVKDLGETLEKHNEMWHSFGLIGNCYCRVPAAVGVKCLDAKTPELAFGGIDGLDTLTSI